MGGYYILYYTKIMLISTILATYIPRDLFVIHIRPLTSTFSSIHAVFDISCKWKRQFIQLPAAHLINSVNRIYTGPIEDSLDWDSPLGGIIMRRQTGTGHWHLKLASNVGILCWVSVYNAVLFWILDGKTMTCLLECCSSLKYLLRN